MVEGSIEKGAIVYRIVIDQSLCSGFGVCAELAPEVIEVGPDGLARLRVGSSADPKVLEAASACPMAAITVFQEEAA
jgi:ferredoxin